jgi:hypothetical protein
MISAHTGIQLSRPLVSRSCNRSLTGCLLILLVLAIPLKAKEWRGIDPLYSTREDVERLLGPPTMGRSDTSFYQFERERVSFEYSTGHCANGWKAPSNTVISIWVTPSANQLRFKDLKLNLKTYKRVQDGHVHFIFH